jgi:hypothetical protein
VTPKAMEPGAITRDEARSRSSSHRAGLPARADKPAASDSLPGRGGPGRSARSHEGGGDQGSRRHGRRPGTQSARAPDERAKVPAAA